MPTVRGFVERLEVGRAGLVTLTLLQDDGSHQDYRIPDLDADPERFNEYLSKLALLRDAMDRAEPVEVEYDDKEGATRGLVRVARITRDQLAGPGKTQRVTVSVVGAVIGTAAGSGPHMESADLATIIGMAADGSVQRYVLDMQIPERAVAQAQLAALLRAQEAGATVSLEVTAESLRIVAVGVGDTDEQGSASALDTVDGFVESIAHSPFATSFSGTAQVMLTSAPPFNGAGNMVPLEPFTPQPVALLVAAGSAEYKLFVLALADKLRVRVMLSGAARDNDTATNRVVEGGNFTRAVGAGNEARLAKPLLVRGARVLHALCSASRPVWIEVRRRSLDIGPEAACTEGVPPPTSRCRPSVTCICPMLPNGSAGAASIMASTASNSASPPPSRFSWMAMRFASMLPPMAQRASPMPASKATTRSAWSCQPGAAHRSSTWTSTAFDKGCPQWPTRPRH